MFPQNITNTFLDYYNCFVIEMTYLFVKCLDVPTKYHRQMADIGWETPPSPFYRGGCPWQRSWTCWSPPDWTPAPPTITTGLRAAGTTAEGLKYTHSFLSTFQLLICFGESVCINFQRVWNTHIHMYEHLGF